MTTLWKEISFETARSTKYNYFIRHPAQHVTALIANCLNKLKRTEWRCPTYVTFTQESVEPSTREDKSYYDPSKRREPLTHQKAIIWKWQDANRIHRNPETTDELLRIRYRNVDIYKMCAISWRAEQPSASQYISCFPWATIPPSLHTQPPNTAQAWLLTASLKT